MSTNISKQKREDLIKKIKSIRIFISKAEQDENSSNLLSYLSELEKEVKGKKYGLVFEEHREEVDEIMETHTPVLTEDKELFIDNGGQMNFLIEGDNLPALELLEKTHKGKIDLIYIDPPYNTGNKDFIYDDKYIDKDDSFKHSKWLSFISPKLISSKKLLSKNGILMISINDKEQAQLKLLCDSIFGEGKFVTNLIWKSRQNKDNRNLTGISIDHEYIICYAKKSGVKNFLGTARKTEQYSNPDNDHRGPWASGNMVGILDEKQRPNCHYDLIHPITNINYGKPKMGWRYDKNTMGRLINEDRIIFPIKTTGRPRRKVFLNELKESTTGYSSIVGSDIYTRNGTDDLNSVFEDKVFSFPKPVGLIFELISQATNKESIVLDFFAGSGTTGHAVLKKNIDDNGTRKFILCTNNENNICRDVTYERIKRVIEKEDHTASLKYYKVDFVPISGQMYYEYAGELLKHTRELVELENGINFTDNAKIAIILTDDELSNFMANIDDYKKCKKIYLGHDVLASGEQEQLLKDRKIKVNTIPDYFYKELAS